MESSAFINTVVASTQEKRLRIHYYGSVEKVRRQSILFGSSIVDDSGVFSGTHESEVQGRRHVLVMRNHGLFPVFASSQAE